MSIVYDFKENIKKNELDDIADALNKGKIVVFPTETVYGIGADATNDVAVKKIFEAKGRPQDNPLIVHISNYKMLEDVAQKPNDTEMALMKAFWPGPFTIILKCKGNLPKSVTAGLDTVGIRMPDNNIALSIIDAAKKPIAAPSANESGKPSGTNLKDIFKELDNRVDYFVDGGNTDIGVESTVVKVDGDVVDILRPGKISVEDINKLGIKVRLDEHVFKDVKENEVVQSPGMKHKHYAPSTDAILVEYDEDDEKMLEKMRKFKDSTNLKVGAICFDEHEKDIAKLGITTIKMGSKSDLMNISKNIFSLIRKIDLYDLDVCLIEGVKKEYIGTAIMNRMIRACGYKIL